MKRYIKRFNESSILFKLIDEIESIKYLLEDEGYKIVIAPQENNKNIISVTIYYPSLTQKEKLKSIIRLQMANYTSGRVQFDEYEEFISRLTEISQSFKYKVVQYSFDVISLIPDSIS